MTNEKKLEVKNLAISFRTQSGKVQAVRKISFDLYKGETLAIVGESGSGKSVTSRAIMGILAGNSIVEGGEIIYDGKDLLKIPEEEMCTIRGDKVAMIFQDPLSSLDPIMKIGKQLTEAMLLKNKANRRNSRKDFNKKLAILLDKICANYGEGETETKAHVKDMCKTFNAFNIYSLKMENAYNVARDAALETIALIKDFLYKVEKRQNPNVKSSVSAIVAKLAYVKDAFFTAGQDEEIAKLRETLKTTSAGLKELDDACSETLKETKAFMEKLLEKEKPNFFRFGYYMLKNPTADLTTTSVEEANQMAYEYLNENFMNEFISFEMEGLKFAHTESLENKKKVLEAMPAIKEYFETQPLEKGEAHLQCKQIVKLVEDSINRLAIQKDNLAYTFGDSLKYTVDKFFFYKVNNPKEEKRFAKQTAKRERLIAKGKNVDWKVAPKVYVEEDELRQNILHVLTNLENKYQDDLTKETPDFNTNAIALIDFFKDKASQVVYRITRRMAREEAIRLMEEVGIPEARIRYNQYPFEFSGGMRQRIVIAIALAANPDILICDEPTTALDVTIQAQILELINKLKKERNLSVIFITHDLGVVANMADRIAVMYAGKLVEYGTSQEVFYSPRHPYTWALLSSMPDLDTNEKLDAIPGTPPNMIYPPVGDAFAARNKYAMAIDYEQQPPMFEITPTHYAATWLLHPDAPKVEIPKVILDRIARMKSKSAKGEDNGGEQ